MSQPTYEYRPLDPSGTNIRLLRLLPAADADSPLQSALLHVDLASKPQYEALSYAWGKPVFAQEVDVEGAGVIRITKNLSHALRHLRLETEPRTLWVDAVCINQADVAERGHQVTLMQAIFSSCERCLVWMGPLKPYSDLTASDAGQRWRKWCSDTEANVVEAMALFERIADHDVKLLRTIDKMDENDMVFIQGPHADGYYLPRKETEVLTELFVSAAPWKRAWCVQELACAPRLFFVAGGATLDWKRVEDFLRTDDYADAFHASFGHGRVHPAVESIFSSPKRIQQQRQMLENMRRREGTGMSQEHTAPSIGREQQQSEHPGWERLKFKNRYDERFGERDEDSRGNASTLIDVLARFRHLEASDPRDMVYGLLGLVEGPSPGVTIDYSLSPAELFIKTTTAIIDSRGDLDAICQNPWFDGRPERRPPNLPSWAIDFAGKGKGNLIFAQRGIFAAGRPSCQTPCDVKSVIAGSDAAHVAGLRCHGRHFGQLKSAAIGRDKGGDTNFLFPEEVIAEAFPSGYLSDPKSLYQTTGEPAIQALWRTLAMDCTAYPIRRLTLDEIEAETRRFQELMMLQEEPAGDGESWKEKRISIGKSYEAKRKVWDKMESWRMLQRNQMGGWHFFMTTDGKFIVARKQAQEGDVVAVLDGAKVPVILRPTQGMIDGVGCFTFVCSAYVHGCMDGEEIEGTGTQDLFLI
ncbi:uncharacterized protein PgNI_02156 [Pyricularia grisea]|uniref:Heterokaryon incompatibility domain-containing protein n=1 Tax=Pyricularia grisea TaxID=148305 RepID=A0A6P8BIZ2_PYRGI|nr:uncharacterized protein PgNI_02156 [Pyricularia grisea]TLD16753.1 hypothetical protein PgNI_02156 [Pyricularia grisea]